MNDNLVELLNTLETQYKNSLLEGLIENEDFFSDTPLQEHYNAFREITKILLKNLKTVATRNNSFDVKDSIEEILDNLK